MVSGYIPSVTFREDSAIIIRERFIDPILVAFFAARGIHSFVEIPCENTISPLDFMNVRMAYFYKVLFAGIRDQMDAGIVPRYSLTFDADCVDSVCNSTNTRFSCISIGDKPCFFYILIELQDLMRFTNSNRILPCEKWRSEWAN